MFVLNITNKCNLKCKYCFANAGMDGASQMSDDVLDKIIHIIAQTESKSICIDFHGGEPLIMYDFIKSAIQKIESYIPDKNINYTTQTNGTLLNSNIIDFMKEYRISTGISLDGPQTINDENRIFNDGKGSFSSVIKNIKLAQSKKLNISIISVISDPKNLKTCYEFFKSNNIFNVKFVPVMPQGRGLTKKYYEKFFFDYAKYELEIFEQMILDRRKGINMFLISPCLILRNIVFCDNRYMCMRAPCGAGMEILSFDQFGNIIPCDSMTGIDNDNFIVGNINEFTTLREIINTSKIQRLRNKSIEKIEKCNSCEYKRFCGGGCCSETFDFYGTIYSKSPLCDYYKIIIEGIFSFLDKYEEDIIGILKYMKQGNI